MKNAIKAFLFILILLVGITGLGVYWTFYRPLPDYTATVELSHLDNRVNIYWDSFGVPHIYAKNKRDLYHAVGYVHAQDRLWQMTLSQMAAEGRFSEFLGKEMLPYDRLQRTIGFWRTAQKMEQQLSPDIQSYLEAYAQGVNDYVALNRRSLPIEFSLADMEPIPWETTHTLAIARMMAWELNIAWKVELNNALLREQLTQEQFRELFPRESLYGGISDHKGTLQYARVLKPLLRKQQELDELLQLGGSQRGSNAWAAAPSRTDTDAPLLAGDPHLGLNMPGKWYELHLNQNRKNLSGATLPGAPFVILGQNDQLAWSLTNIMLDDTDFFEEAVNPENRNQYVMDTLAGEPVYDEFSIQRELIKIKGADDTMFTRKLTRHGPVVSEVYPRQQTTDDRLIAMSWTGHEVTGEFSAFEAMGWAESMEEFSDALKSFKVPGQNVIYADTAGNIAHFTAAHIPVRSGHPMALRPGWNPELDWQGYVPYSRMPKIVNPDRGWVANANNAIGQRDAPAGIFSHWQTDFRYRRIEQYLQRQEVLTSEIFQLMQNDTYSTFAADMTEQILPVLNEHRGDNKYFDTAISYLENWDHTYGPSETAASIMDSFTLQLTRNVLEDEMGPAAYEAFINITQQPTPVILRLIKEGSPFFDNVNTPERESRRDMIIESMEQALDYLVETQGSETIEWRWENLHGLTLAPPLLGEAAKDPEAPSTLKLIVNNILSKGPYPVGGHSMSVNNGEYRWNQPYDMVIGPSIRRIVDFSDLSSTLSVTPTGQSGNPISEFYGDQTESWLNGQYKFLYQDSTLFNEVQYRTMVLKPAE